MLRTEMRKPAVLMILTYLIPTYCVRRTYETYYFPYLKCLLKISTLPLVLTCGLYCAIRTAHCALRTTHVTTQTTQSNYMSRATQLHLHLHLARYCGCNCNVRLEISTPDQHRNLINYSHMTSHQMLRLSSMIFR